MIFQKGWTHLFMDKIWLIQKLPCPFTFKKGYVLKRKRTMKFNGYCRECGNSIEGLCDTDSENHTFVISTRDSSKICHFEKRPLSGPLREKSKKELMHLKALKFKTRSPCTYGIWES